MNLDKKLKEFEKKQQKIQSNLLDASKFPDSECISFGGITLHPDMRYSLFEKDKLNLAHSVVHTVFSTQSDNKKIARRIHRRLVEEFSKRDINHQKFDKLDETIEF